MPPIRRSLIALLVFAALNSDFCTGGYPFEVRRPLSQLENFLDDGWLPSVARFASENVHQREAISPRCLGDLSLWAASLTDVRDPWALNMLDAGGKIPSGLAGGNVFGLGHFDECLEVDRARSPAEGGGRLRGKYCPTLYQITKDFPLGMALCQPDSCRAEEMQRLIIGLLNSLGLNVNETQVQMLEASCSMAEAKPWTGFEISALVVFSFFGLLIVLSTAYELIAKFCLKKEYPGHDFCISFSLYTNTSKLTTISKSSSTLRCMHGLRTLSMLWIMVGHLYSNFRGYPMQNIFDIAKWRFTYPAMLIVGAGVSVDTFFAMSGFLLAYLFCSQHANKKCFNLPLFYLHRFLRLWPAMAALIFFEMTLFKRLGSGPAWPLMTQINNAVCETDWWATLIYVQNYVSKRVLCVGHLWYLAIDMHLYILSPILLYPILKLPKYALWNIIAWNVAAQVAVITIVYTHNWGGILPGQADYWYRYYQATETRAAVWVLGFLGGYLMYQLKKKGVIRMNKIVAALIWILVLFVQGVIIFGVHDMYQPGHEINHLEDSTFSAFSRTAWCLCILWIIFACANGYGGPINWVLSFRVWEVVGRLSYSIYLLHITVQTWTFGSQRIVPHFHHFTIIYMFLGDIPFTIMVAYLWSMAFEAPFMALEKALFGKKKPVLPTTKDTEEPSKVHAS